MHIEVKYIIIMCVCLLCEISPLRDLFTIFNCIQNVSLK